MPCPRCNKPSKNPNNPAGRCSKHLSKLKADKKSPGHWQHAQKIADDALRRQDGKTKTASKKSSGRGSRKEIIGKVRAAYSKHGKGTTLSPDRKDNDKGYGSKNTRMVPKKLNRGRHKVDEKKLSNWKSKMKKCNITAKELILLAAIRAQEKGDEVLAKSMLENGSSILSND